MTQNLKLTLLKSWRPPITLQHLLLVMHSEAWRGTLKSFTKNLAGKFFITGGGEDVFASYTLRYDKNVFFITTKCVYEVNFIITLKFSHTYFQNCMRECNHLDGSIKHSMTVSLFKVVKWFWIFFENRV